MSVTIDPVTGISAPAIVTATPATSTTPATRQLAQIVTYQTGAVATGTTTIPLDDTIPQNTEGNEYMTLAITPTNAASTLEIEFVIQLDSNAANVYIASLFQDSTANALATVFSGALAAGISQELTLTHIMTAGTTSATTFKVRAGKDGAGTTTFNGREGARMFGGVCTSRITIKEWLA